MKRKVVGILVTGMIMVSLAGCGTTEATEQTSESSSTITDIDNEATETEVAETEVPDASKDTEKDTENEISGTKYGYLYIYKEKVETGYELDLDACMPFNDKVVEYTFTSNIPVYYTGGTLAGYAEAGSPITFDNGSSEWLRFVPDVAGVTVPYLMVRNEDIAGHTDDEIVEVEGAYEMTPEDVEEMLIEAISMRGDKDEITFLSAPESDMETVEFTIWKQYRRDGVKSAIWEALGDESVMFLTYCVKCTGDKERIDCIVYYKDMVTIVRRIKKWTSPLFFLTEAEG